MFLEARQEIYKKEIYQNLPCNQDVKGLIGSYIEIEDKECIGVDASPLFEITAAGCFFRQQFYSNCHFGMTLGGHSFGIAGMMYPLLPCLLLDLLIYYCQKIFKPEPDFNFFVTSSVYYTLVIIGMLLSSLICILPAFIHAGYHALDYKFNKTRQQASGKEIYALLTRLEKKNFETVDKMISNIIQAYKESFHGTDSCEHFPGLLFKRDKQSEELYRYLKDLDATQTEQTKAIEEFMKSKNKNAGKKMFNIILDKLESTPDVREQHFYWAHDIRGYERSYYPTMLGNYY